MCDLFGYDEHSLLQKTWADVTAPEDVAESREVVEDLWAGRKDSYRITKQYLHADGHHICGELTLSCIRDSAGAVEYLLAQIIDMTEQVELRTHQSAADARFRRLMETSNVGMALATPDGRFDVVNQALCDMLGYDEETLKTHSWQSLTPAKYMEADKKNVEELLAGRLDTYRVIKEHLHADGHGVWTNLSVSCLRDSSGAIEYLAGQLIDITEEVEARERLARRERENRILAARLQAEIRSAAEYVRLILPDDLDGPVEVSSRYLPSLDLGGDGFHFRWIDDDHLKIYLVDVSGHGIRPAFVWMSVHNLIRSGALDDTTLRHPDRVLDKLNTVFQMDEQADVYFTIWYGIYQRSTRTLRYASAGHPPALALNRDGDGGVTATPLTTPACPVGMFGDTVYTCDTYRVPAGGQLLLYSDGAFELPTDDAVHMPLSHNGFVEVCSDLAADPEWSLDELVARLRALSPSGDFDDDCALVLLRFPEES